MKLELAKNTEIFALFSSIIVIQFTLVEKAITAPENFNPELESSPKLDSIPDSRDRPLPSLPNLIPTTEEKTTPPLKKTQNDNNLFLPSPNIVDESAIESGTADIELTTKKNSNAVGGKSTLQIDNLSFDYQLDSDNFGQTNLLINQRIDFSLSGLDLALDTGINLFRQDDLETVNNIPLYLSWETKIGKVDLTLTSGVDFFDRLAAVPTATIKASSPLFSSITPDGKLKSLFVLSGQIQYQAYKFNAATLDNEINFLRFTPSIYWQIAPDLSLFSLGQYGSFNDGNRELQSFSRLEKKFGSFSLAANLFTWNFDTDLSEISGYFSPTDFLVYNGELGWQGTMFDEILDCKLSAAFGKQTLGGITDNAWTYKALCGAQLLDNLELDLGYTYSNVRDRNTGDTNFGNQSIKGRVNIEL